ncbi:hypothetical protein PS2_027215 [Malus domestica]
MGPIFQLTWRKKDKALTCKAQYLLKRQAFPLINAVVEFLPAVASILLSRRRGAFAHLLVTFTVMILHGQSQIILTQSKTTPDRPSQRHLEKQNELLTEAKISMSEELHQLKVEEEMLMRKFYEIMSAHGKVKKNEGCGKVSDDGEIGRGPLMTSNSVFTLSNECVCSIE